jgi:uncharacterized membrane protein
VRRTRPRRWLLVGSLALNLFLIGVVVAYQLRGAVPSAQPSTQLRIEQIAETLPKPDADRLEAIFRGRAAELSEYTTAIRQSQDRQRDGFRAQPFDPKPVEAAMTTTRFNHDAAKRVIHEVILEAATQMSPAGRAKLAEWASPPAVDVPR